MTPAPAFIITRSRRLPGARLSMPGSWGNLPFDTADAAEARAREIGGPAARITHENGR